MSRRLSVLTALMLLAIPLSQAQENKAVNLTGTWDMTVELPHGTATPVMTLKQEGEKLTGEYHGSRGAFVVGGTLKGKQVNLYGEMGTEGVSLSVSFAGEVNDAGDKIVGAVDFSGYGGGAWTASKRKG